MKLPDALEGRSDFSPQRTVNFVAFAIISIVVVLGLISLKETSEKASPMNAECGQNLNWLKTAIGRTAEAACLRTARQQVRFHDFKRYAAQPGGQIFEWKADRPGIATVRQTNVNLESNSGALTGFSYECDVDPPLARLQNCAYARFAIMPIN